MGKPLGRGPARLAHRVQRDGYATARRTARYSLRGRGQYLPASRSGDRADRRLHGEAVRSLLDALRASDGGGAENGEISRKFLYAAGCDREGIQRAGGAVCADAGALSRAVEFHLGRNGGGEAGVGEDR